ncbi:HPP family protein [Calditrichota bacterium]
MQERRARDIMIPLDSYPHIPYWFTLRQVVAEMEKSEIEIDGKQSLPRVVLVFDEQYQLLGTVRRRDIMKGLEPKFIENMGHHKMQEPFTVEGDTELIDFTSGKVAQSIREQAERPVSSVMTPITSTADADDHLAKLIYMLVSRDISLLPVLDNGKVVGVVRSVDLLHEVAEILE